VISPRSQQPSRQSANSDEYDRLFITRVHQLIISGYDRLNPKQYAADEETSITGDLVEAVEVVLDYPAARWMRFYSIFDDPPENPPKRRGRPRRRGKKRKRVDIRFVSAETSPRLRFRFECKRLGKQHNVVRYLGDEGLGCFLRGKYAAGDIRAGMLGYIQSDNEETWAKRVEQRMIDSAKEYSLLAGSPWRNEPLIKKRVHTFRSGHGRGRGQKPIEVFHTLLRFY